MGLDLNNIDQSIIKLLDKLNAHYPGFDSRRTELIADDWCRELCIYSDQVLKKAYSEIIISFSKRPTLAEFVAACAKQITANAAKIGISAQVNKKISDDEYLLIVKNEYGINHYLDAKNIFSDYQSKNDTEKGIRQKEIMDKIRAFCKKK
jgi:hypothetical protein